MKVTRLSAIHYRNLKELEIYPQEGVNIIYGENAQGKTNLLESIWMFTGCRSFRGAKDAELISLKNEAARLEMDFYAEGREQEATLLLDEKRHAVLNGIPLPSASKLIGEFRAVVFSPAHLSLVKEGPVQRRRFLDLALSQLRPRYASLLSQYNRALAQRNILLKDIAYHSELMDTLAIWDERLAMLGAQIIYQRRSYVDRMQESAVAFYHGLSRGREELSLAYASSIEGRSAEEIAYELSEKLTKNPPEDIKNGRTSVGPHRDDLEIYVDQLSARIYGSQGQQRSCALSMKLSEAALIREITGEQPVALLDDVMSELDAGRQDYILNHIEGWQVFITCCEPSSLLRLCDGKTFSLHSGSLEETA